MVKFSSGFASSMEALLSFRETYGFLRKSYEPSLKSFDRYCLEHCPQATHLSREIVLSWLEACADKEDGNAYTKARIIRALGHYLVSVGVNAYVLPDGLFGRKRSFMPYIFSDAELATLFRAADQLQPRENDTLAPVIAPVLLRLIYTCGLRPGEGNELKRGNVNFATGEILIAQNKQKKQRVVVMSDDMLSLCRRYDQQRSFFAGESDFFFPAKQGKPYPGYELSRLFLRCWREANPNIPATALPPARVYDLRHRFASAALNRWLDAGCDIYAMLPFLQAYMGHEKISSTAYYVHLLPENLVKSAGIDWASLSKLVPEVCP
jgi:integrase